MKNQEQQEPRQAAVQTASSEDQDYIYTPVPQNKRYGWIKMFFVWLCWNVVVGDLATGTALGSSLNFRDALIALAYTVFRTVPRYPAPIMAERMISPIFGRLSWRCCEQRGSPPWSPPVFGRMTTVSRRICWPRQKSSRDGE